jgi:protein-disulfide isomerase
MHDKLFGNQQKLQVADLKATAAELGLDPQAFGECLDSAKHEAAWHADQEQGNAYGVSGTPAFFINGRFLSGAQPYENFAQVVDDELQRKGVAKAK